MEGVDWADSGTAPDVGRRLGRKTEAGSLPPLLLFLSTLAPRSAPVILTKAKAKMKTYRNRMRAYAAADPYRRLEASSWTSMEIVSTELLRAPMRM